MRVHNSELESAQITRRNFLFATPALVMAAPRLLGQEAFRPAITTRRLNNVMIAVSEMERSVDFYRKLFGAPIQHGDFAIFPLGQKPAFFGITQAKMGAKPDFLSFGLTVENFYPNQLAQILTALGAKNPQVTLRDGTPEVFAGDPDGIRFQLQDVSYAHGGGPLGAVLPPQSKAPSEGAFQLQSVSHVTLTITDGQRTEKFYQDAFSLPVQVRQGTASACYAIGSGPDCIVFSPAANNPNASTGVNHACFTIENFEPNRVMGVLEDNGLTPIEYGIASQIKPMTCRLRLRQRGNNGGGPSSPIGTPELYFNDPDNIAMQLQDVSYCGGSGALGQICP